MSIKQVRYVASDFVSSCPKVSSQKLTVLLGSVARCSWTFWMQALRDQEGSPYLGAPYSRLQYSIYSFIYSIIGSVATLGDYRKDFRKELCWNGLHFPFIVNVKKSCLFFECISINLQRLYATTALVYYSKEIT